MLNPLISVIIPTYNRPIFLCELLESLFRQTLTSFEVIVVNDCGQPVEFIKELYPELSIVIVNTPSNQKHVHARNAGLSHACGEYIMLCDDDDLLLAGHMQRMVHEITDFDLVYSDVEIFDYIVENNQRIPISRFLFAYNSSVAEMRKFSTFVPSGCLYRRKIHNEIGPFDPLVYHYWDWDFFLRVSGKYRVKRVPSASVLYAFSHSGDHQSVDVVGMGPYLSKLSAKHGLGELPAKNFFLLLQEKNIKNRRAISEVLWDGLPIVSRLKQGKGK